jgi:hypothetical protein
MSQPNNASLDTTSKCAIGIGAIRGGLGVYQVIWGWKRKDYRSIRNGLEGLVDGARSALSGVEGRAQWTGVGASVGGAIEQASQIRRNRILERIKAGRKGHKQD